MTSPFGTPDPAPLCRLLDPATYASATPETLLGAKLNPFSVTVNCPVPGPFGGEAPETTGAAQKESMRSHQARICHPSQLAAIKNVPSNVNARSVAPLIVGPLTISGAYTVYKSMKTS